MSQNQSQGISLLIDFEKAFDSLNWNVLFKTLEYVNFGNIFIGYVKTMSNNIQSTILNIGNTGKYLNLKRHVRQGCHLSAYVFIIALETLASNPDLQGIEIDNNEKRLTCFQMTPPSLSYI